MSHPVVHPVAVPPAAALNVIARGRSKDMQGMPGTLGSLALRLCQFVFSVIAFSVMVSIKDFSTVTAFCYLVAATALQSLWSLSVAILDGYALMFKRSLRKSAVVTLFAVGDWVTATLTLAAACSCAGITVLIGKDLDQCGVNHCGKFEAAVAVTFLCWFLASLSFFFSFWLLATR